MNEEIEITPELLKEFLETTVSPALKLEAEVAQMYGSRIEKVMFRSLDNVFQIITALGIIAGFGFTALDHVQARWMFFFAEILLCGVILSSLFWIQKNHDDICLAMFRERKEALGKIRSRSSKGISLLRKMTETGHASIGEIQDILTENNSVLDDAESKRREAKDIEMPLGNKLIPQWIPTFSILGAALLLGSFVNWTCILRHLL